MFLNLVRLLNVIVNFPGRFKALNIHAHIMMQIKRFVLI